MPRARGVLLAGMVVLASVGTIVAPASAATAQKAKSCKTANGIKVTNTEVCKGLAFYKGQTMTFIEPASVGGPFDLQAEAEIPGLQSYLGATINETRITTGNSIPGQDSLAAAPPTGLTIGLLNPLNDASLILENQPGINFNPYRMAYLAGTAPPAVVLQALPSSGITNFSKFLAGAKAGTVRVVTQATGSENTVFRAEMAALGGIKNAGSSQWVTGYTSLTLEITGFLRNDAPTGYLNLSNTCTLLQGNQSVALATNNIPPPGTDCRKYLTGVPTLADLAKTYAKTTTDKTLFKTAETLNDLTGNPTVTQTAVAGDKVDALRAALQWVYQQQSFKSDMLNNGMSPGYISPTAAKQLYETALTLGKTVICYVNSAIACSKV
jgi:tripartite-type tricarboxylate transporter receptor subunit TctC